MPDLIQLAKSGKLAEFRKEYIVQNGWDANSLTQSQSQTILNEFQSMKNFSSSTTSTGGGGTGGGTGGGGGDGKSGIVGVLSNLVVGAKELIKTQESQAGAYFPTLEQQLISVDNVMDIFLSKQGKLNSLQEIGNNIIKLTAEQVQGFYKEQTKLLEEVNSKAQLTGSFSKDFRETITSAQPRLLQLGIGMDDLANSAISLVEQSGRFAIVNQQTLEKAGEVGKAYIGDMRQMVSLYGDFEKVGIGAMDANLAIERAGKKSMELGLQARKTITDIQTNMSRLNEYGFKNGIDGLATMVRKATEFRMSMESVFKIAGDVMDPDKALALSANLQVLGGAIGDFNDPLKLMYMATNNVEGLQDALIGAAGGLATYNTEQKRFEITGVNLRRAKEMAAQLGVNYDELARGAIAAAEKSAAASALIARGLTLDKEQTEFLTNIARMKDGKMTIDLGQSPKLQELFGKQEVALDELSNEQAQQILTYQKELKQKTTEDIARGQASSIENIKRDVNYLAIMARNRAGKIGIDLANEMGVGPIAQEKLAKSTQTESKEGAKIVDNYVKVSGEQIVGFVKEGKKALQGMNMTKDNKTSKTKTTTTTDNNKTIKDQVADGVVQGMAASNVNKKSSNKFVTFTVQQNAKGEYVSAVDDFAE